MLDAASLGTEPGLVDMLGRLSQLIEELPWLYGMTAHLVQGSAASSPDDEPALDADITIGFQKAGSV
jgi:hypothetical protein